MSSTEAVVEVEIVSAEGAERRARLSGPTLSVGRVINVQGTPRWPAEQPVTGMGDGNASCSARSAQ